MEEKIAHEPPVTIGDAWNQGLMIGLELNEARKQMREVIANNIKVCRTAMKLTQDELSKRIGINYLTYRGYENCKSDIPIVYLIRLADVFEVSLDYLTGRTQERKPIASETNNESDVTARLEQLEKAVAKLSEIQSTQE